MVTRILKLGWKNIWRNPARSGVVIVAVLLGTWAGIFLSAFFNGMAQGYLRNQLDLSIGHIQIAHPQFGDQQQPDLAIADFEELRDALQSKPWVTGYIAQSLTGGLAQSAANSFGVMIHGVAADAHHPITEHLKEGSYLDTDTRYPAVIGGTLQERLNIEMDSKVVLTFQDVEGNITAGAFRVNGIFRSFNSTYDRANVFVPMEELNRLLGEEGLIHRVTLKVDDFTAAEAYVSELEQQFPELYIASWGEIAPELQYAFDMMDVSLYIIMIIIIVALIFSIINTMLMAILERTRELGMLMAVGMNRTRIFSMILAETFFLTMVGAPAGLLLSWATVSAAGRVGIDLGAFAEGLNAFGVGTVIHPELGAVYYLNVTLMIAAAAFLSALWPAWKTLKLKPVEAIRKL